MPWKRTATVTTTEVAYDACLVSGISVFRGAQSLFGWKKDAEKLAWVHPLKGDALFGMKRVFAVPGAAVTLNDTSSEQPKRLVWLDPATGAVKQEHPYPLGTSQYGFTATGQLLFLHGRTAQGGWSLLRISSETGQILEQTDAPQGVELRASSRRLYLGQQSRGLFHTPVDSARWTRTELDGVAGLSIWGNQLFFTVMPTQSKVPWELVWWDADEPRPRGRIPLEVPQALEVKASPQEGVVSAHDMKRGLWVLDLGAGTCRWKLPLKDGEKVMSACWTPHGLIIAVQPGDEDTRLESRDPMTGELLERLPGTRFDVTYVGWLGDRVISSGIDGLEAFAWNA